MNRTRLKRISFLSLILLTLRTSNAGAQDSDGPDSERPEVHMDEQFGALHYRVPFPRLPSRAGVQPDLSLSSSQTRGDRGQGFGLAWSVHVPSITILNETHLRSHAFNDSMQTSFDAKFRLAWDGAELSFVNFDRENVLAEYSLEKSSQVFRIFRHFYPFVVDYLAGDGQKLSRTFHSGFEVLYPDGRRQYYSGDLDVAEGREVPSPDPKIDPVFMKTFVSRWPLVLEVHPGGEAIHYNYFKDQGRSFLQRVSFAGGHSFYQLNWILRDSGPQSMAYGFPQRSRLLYTGMAACFKGNALQTWRFDYGADLPKDWPDASCDPSFDATPFEGAPEGFVEKARTGLRHMATQLRAWADRARVAAMGEKTYPTTAVPRLAELYRLGQKPAPRLKFRYATWVKPAPQSVRFEAPAPAGGHTKWIAVNRDGLFDLVKSDGRVSQPMHSALNEDRSPSLFLRGDIDGDGWRDVLEIKADGTPRAYLRSADPKDRFTASEPIIQEITDAGERALKLIPDQLRQGRGMLIDVSGDGKDDLLSVQKNSRGRLEWSVLINETPRSSPSLRFKKQAYAFPFLSSDEAILEGAALRFVDMNGDGLIDLVRPVMVNGEFGICVHDNLGRAGFPNRGEQPLFDGSLETENCRADQFRRLQDLEKPDREHLMQMWVLDIDGDGTQDFADLSPDGRMLDYWLANSGQTSFQERRSLALFPDAEPTAHLDAGVLDLDQNGQDELVLYQPSDRKVKILDFNRRNGKQGLPAGLLYAVESEDGGLDQFIYTNQVQELLEERAAHPASAASVSSIPDPKILLKQWIHRSRLNSRNAAEDRRTKTWHYAKAIWDESMGRWLGYAEVIKDEAGSLVKGQSRPAKRTVHSYPFRTDDREAQRYLSATLERTAIYEVPWTQLDEKLFGSDRNGPGLDPDRQMYQSQLLPLFKGPARLLRMETYDPRYQLFKGSAEGATTHSLVRALTYVSSVETKLCGDHDNACLSPHVEHRTYQFDDKGRIIRETMSQRGVDREVTRESVYDGASEDIGILLNPATITTRRRDGRTIQVIERSFHPILGKVLRQTFSPFPDNLRGKMSESFEYDVFGNRIAIRDSLGRRLQLTYDREGLFVLKAPEAHDSDLIESP